MLIDSSDERFVEVTDPGATITAGDNCVATSDHRALCRKASLITECCAGDAHFSEISLGEGDDRLRLVGPHTFPFVDVDAGPGNDVVVGGQDTSVDLLGGAGDDRLVGGRENDRFAGGSGDDFLKGNGGVDTVDYSDRTEDLSVTIDDRANDGAAGEADNVQAENVLLGSGDDHVVGNAVANGLDGGAGADRIVGRAGADALSGGLGSDVVLAGRGADRIVLAYETERDTARCGPGADRVAADPEDVTPVDCELTLWGFTPPELSIAGPLSRAKRGLRLPLSCAYSAGSTVEGEATVRTRRGKLLAHGKLRPLRARENETVELALTRAGRRFAWHRRVRVTVAARVNSDPSSRVLIRRLVRVAR